MGVVGRREGRLTSHGAGGRSGRAGGELFKVDNRVVVPRSSRGPALTSLALLAVPRTALSCAADHCVANGTAAALTAPTPVRAVATPPQPRRREDVRRGEGGPSEGNSAEGADDGEGDREASDGGDGEQGEGDGTSADGSEDDDDADELELEELEGEDLGEGVPSPTGGGAGARTASGARSSDSPDASEHGYGGGGSDSDTSGRDDVGQRAGSDDGLGRTATAASPSERSPSSGHAPWTNSAEVGGPPRAAGASYDVITEMACEQHLWASQAAAGGLLDAAAATAPFADISPPPCTRRSTSAPRSPPTARAADSIPMVSVAHLIHHAPLPEPWPHSRAPPRSPSARGSDGAGFVTMAAVGAAAAAAAESMKAFVATGAGCPEDFSPTRVGATVVVRPVDEAFAPPRTVRQAPACGSSATTAVAEGDAAPRGRGRNTVHAEGPAQPRTARAGWSPAGASVPSRRPADLSRSRTGTAAASSAKLPSRGAPAHDHSPGASERSPGTFFRVGGCHAGDTGGSPPGIGRAAITAGDAGVHRRRRGAATEAAPPSQGRESDAGASAAMPGSVLDDAGEEVVSPRRNSNCGNSGACMGTLQQHCGHATSGGAAACRQTGEPACAGMDQAEAISELASPRRLPLAIPPPPLLSGPPDLLESATSASPQRVAPLSHQPPTVSSHGALPPSSPSPQSPHPPPAPAPHLCPALSSDSPPPPPRSPSPQHPPACSRTSPRAVVNPPSPPSGTEFRVVIVTEAGRDSTEAPTAAKQPARQSPAETSPRGHCVHASHTAPPATAATPHPSPQPSAMSLLATSSSAPPPPATTFSVVPSPAVKLGVPVMPALEAPPAVALDASQPPPLPLSARSPAPPLLPQASGSLAQAALSPRGLQDLLALDPAAAVRAVLADTERSAPGRTGEGGANMLVFSLIRCWGWCRRGGGVGERR